MKSSKTLKKKYAARLRKIGFKVEISPGKGLPVHLTLPWRRNGTKKNTDI